MVCDKPILSQKHFNNNFAICVQSLPSLKRHFNNIQILSDLLSACSEMVSSKEIAMACVDSLMQPANAASSSNDQIITYSTHDGIQNVVFNEEL